MAAFSFNHIHLLTRDPKATAQYYHKMFGAKIIESTQSDGKPRIDLELGGVSIYILRVLPEQETPACPSGPYLGLDHFGLRVNNLDEAVAELKAKGAEFAVEPKTIRPGVRIAYVRGPEDTRIELVEHA
jgi:catechol 2,3-dioxygenase-like lactoylglutathione lyase family enzyme